MLVKVANKQTILGTIDPTCTLCAQVFNTLGLVINACECHATLQHQVAEVNFIALFEECKACRNQLTVFIAAGGCLQ
jgi:hypothetical protein